MPNAVIYGPIEHGEMEMVETYALQDQLQVVNAMKQIRWGHMVANDMLVTLDNI